MGRRPEVATAGRPVAGIDAAGLVTQLGTALLRVPFRRPLDGPGAPWNRVRVAVVREAVRSLMAYAMALPIEEFRSIEILLDDLSGAALHPLVRLRGVEVASLELAGVPTLAYRPRSREHLGTILYLHGGGYVGTSPKMYSLNSAALALETGCQVLVIDYRLAPEFPFPAGRDDALAVLGHLLEEGPSERLFLAGDSAGGGLVASVLYEASARGLPQVGGIILFSPEVNLDLDLPSFTKNADRDVLPWNVPVTAYLHGVDPDDGAVAPLRDDLSTWPPTLVAFGGDEMFRDSIRLLAGRLEEAGVDTVALEEPGMFHVFPILSPWTDASRRVQAAVGDFVGRLLHGTAGPPTAGPPTAGPPTDRAQADETDPPQRSGR